MNNLVNNMKRSCIVAVLFRVKAESEYSRTLQMWVNWVSQPFWSMHILCEDVYMETRIVIKRKKNIDVLFTLHGRTSFYILLPSWRSYIFFIFARFFKSFLVTLHSYIFFAAPKVHTVFDNIFLFFRQFLFYNNSCNLCPIVLKIGMSLFLGWEIETWYSAQIELNVLLV